MIYSVRQALNARPDTNYGITISQMDLGAIASATKYVEMSAGLRALSLSGLLRQVPASPMGRTRLRRRLGSVRRNLDRLAQWGEATGPVSEIEIVVVARAIWVSLQTVKSQLELMIEVVELQMAGVKGVSEEVES